MSAAAAILPEAQGAEGDVEIVVEHQQPFGGNLVEAEQRRDGFAAFVHPGLRLGEDHALVAQIAMGDEGVLLGA